MNTLYYTTTFVFLFICASTAQLRESSNAYHLQITPSFYSSGKIEMVIMVATDPAFGSRKIGSGDLQFLYDTTMFANPVLTSHQFNGAYSPVNLTIPTLNKVSLNFSLNSIGTGKTMTVYPIFTELARVTFDLKYAGSNEFEWTDNIDDTKETVLYFDDEDTLRHPTQMLNVDNMFFAIDLQAFILSWRNSYENDAIIQWVTATEDNTLYFELERSFDGFTGWTKVAEVEALGSANFGTDYKVEDVQVSVLMPDEYVYYRIKEVTVSGEVSYSDVASLKRENKKENNYLSTYPNPFVSDFSAEFSMSSSTNSPVRVAIYTSTGQLLYTEEVLSNQAHLIQIPAENFAAGIYQFQIQANGQSITQKVVKQ